MKRWRRGIEGVTPYQQARMMFLSTWIIILGIVLGIVIAAIGIKDLYWLLIILVGALFNTSIQQIGNYQKMSLLKKLQGGVHE